MIFFFAEDVAFWQNFSTKNGSYNLLAANYLGKTIEKTRFQHLVIDRFFENFCKKMILQREKRESEKRTIFAVSERSLLTNRDIFIQPEIARGNISQIDGEILKWKSETFHDILLKQFEMVPYFVYLKSSPEESFERIRARERTEEKNIELGYLREICETHERLYEKLSRNGENVLIIRIDDFKERQLSPKIDVNRIVGEILSFIGYR